MEQSKIQRNLVSKIIKAASYINNNRKAGGSYISLNVYNENFFKYMLNKHNTFDYFVYIGNYDTENDKYILSFKDRLKYPIVYIQYIYRCVYRWYYII